MPYRSAAQRGYFHANKAKLEAQGVSVDEWDRASKGKKLPYKANRGGAIQSAMNVVRRYADGGDVEETVDPVAEWAAVPRNAEGRPQLTVTPSHSSPPPALSPGEIVSKYAGKAYDWLNAPPVLPERRPAPEVSPYAGEPTQTIGEAGRSLGHSVLENYKEMLSPFTSEADKVAAQEAEIPPAASREGKIVPELKDPISLGAPIMGEVASTFAGVPGTGVGWGLGKAIATGITGVAAKAGVKAATKSALQHGFMDTSHFKAVTQSKGSMPGGFKIDPTTGAEWYVKEAPSLEHAKNEKLTAELYKLLGVPVAEVHLTTVNGKPGIASRKIEGQPLSEYIGGGDYKDTKDLHQDYPVHAWLANHDTVGTGFSNIIRNSKGEYSIIDTGGGLLFRALGKKKAKFSPEVDEIKSMLDPNINEYSAEVFNGLDPNTARIGAQKVANVDGKAIARLVELYGPDSEMDKVNLISTLLKRKHNIEQHYGVKPGDPVPEPAPVPVKEPDIPLTSAREPHQQIPFTEEDYAKWASDDPEAYAQFEKEMMELNPSPYPDDVSRAVEAIKPEPGQLPYPPGGVATPFNPDLKSPGAAFPFTDTIGQVTTKKLTDGTLDKKSLQNIGKKLVSAPYGEDHWAGAVSLWQIAEHVNPQAAEAIFRNLPPSVQPRVGYAIKALKDELEYSPFNSVAKGSGKDGKFPLDYNYYSTQTTKFPIPPALVKDKAFKGNVKTYAKKIEDTKPAEPGLFSSEVDDALAEGKRQHWTNDPYQIHEYLKNLNDPAAAEKIFRELPTGIQKSVDELLKAEAEGKTITKPKPKTQYEKDVEEYEAKLDADLDEPEFHIGGKHNYQWFSQASKSEIDKRFNAIVKPIDDWTNWRPPNQKIKPLKITHKSAEELRKLGFNPDVPFHHGSSKGTPDVLKDPKQYKDEWDERGFFTSDEPYYAIQYGHGMKSYIARAPKAMEVDWNKWSGQSHYAHTQMKALIEAGHRAGVDLIASHNMKDLGSGKHTQYIFLKTENLRQATAKFDPTKLHLRNTLAGVAGVAGGGSFVYGEMQDRKEDDRMNRGGIPGLLHRVKALARGGAADSLNVKQYHPRHPAGMIQSSIPGRTDKIPMSVPPGSYILPADIPSALGQGNTMAGEKILGTMFKTGPYSPASNQSLSGPLAKAPSGRFSTPRQMHIPKMKLADGGQPRFDYRTQDFPKVTRHEVTGSYPITKDLDLVGKAHTFSNEVPLRQKPEDWGASIGLRKTFQEGGEPQAEQEGDIPIIAAGGEVVLHPEQVRMIGHGSLEAGHKVLDAFVLHTRKQNIETLKKLAPPKK